LSGCSFVPGCGQCEAPDKLPEPQSTRLIEELYSTVEKEALALVTSVRAFSPYFGAAPVTVWTDHSPLRYIETMSNHNAKLMRWSLELQRYCLAVQHRPGKLNLLPDVLKTKEFSAEVSGETELIGQSNS